MRVLVSGLVNLETTLRVRAFPIPYYPIDYPFFGVQTDVAGVGYNLAKALLTLGDVPTLFAFLGRDEEAGRILRRLDDECVPAETVRELAATPVSVVLYDEAGKRQIYCDLKDVQDREMPSEMLSRLPEYDLVAACNINFNRPLLHRAKELGKPVATDVHVLGDVEDGFNREFMECADILFLSDERLPCAPEDFVLRLRDRYPCRVIAVGLGGEGALLFDRAEGSLTRLSAVPCENVVNTVGAGDALFSGFLHYYGKGLSPLEALMRAELFASVKIGFNGAANGFCGENELERAFESRRPAVLERRLV